MWLGQLIFIHSKPETVKNQQHHSETLVYCTIFHICSSLHLVHENMLLMVIMGSCYMSLPGYDRIGGVNSSGAPPLGPSGLKLSTAAAALDMTNARLLRGQWKSSQWCPQSSLRSRNPCSNGKQKGSMKQGNL
jgi:hypothetical protein